MKPSSLDVEDRAEAELDSSWIKTSTLSFNEIGLKINSNVLCDQMCCS